MATYSTPLYTAQAGAAGASLNVNIPLAKNSAGKVRYAQVPYALNGNEAANEVVQLNILKKGSRIIAAKCRVLCETIHANAALIVKFGDANNAIRYANSLTIGGTASNDVPFSASPGTDLLVPTDINQPIPPATATDETVPLMTVVSTGTLVAAKKLLILLAYVDE